MVLKSYQFDAYTNCASVYSLWPVLRLRALLSSFVEFLLLDITYILTSNSVLNAFNGFQAHYYIQVFNRLILHLSLNCSIEFCCKKKGSQLLCRCKFVHACPDTRRATCSAQMSYHLLAYLPCFALNLYTTDGASTYSERCDVHGIVYSPIDEPSQ